MTEQHGPIYEVTFFVDVEVVGKLDRWLDDHVRKSLRQAAIADCRIISIPGDESGREGRLCHHVLETDDALDAFVDGVSADIETDIAAAFGGRVQVTSRVLREDAMLDMPDVESPDCLNCGTRLRGQYCGNCGQRSRSRLISLWELVSDAFGDLFEIDSRLWRTLVPLTIRPGTLTHDYLQGRRARYMPPFRMYLVMSVVFFVIAFFDPRGDLGLVTENEPEAPATADLPNAAPAPEDFDGPVLDTDNPQNTIVAETHDLTDAERARLEIFEELSREGIIAGDGSRRQADSDAMRFQFGDDFEFEVGEGGEKDDCKANPEDFEDVPEWIAWLVSADRVEHICERIMADNGRSLAREILDNVPAALIVLLPLMAIVLKMLYPLSRRYYVEHLLFFVHFHGFFFLILTLQVLFARLGALVLPDTATALTIVVTSSYVPIYLFVALRRVYGQSRIVTFLKYIILVIAYIAGFTTTMLGALAIAALSI